MARQDAGYGIVFAIAVGRNHGRLWILGASSDRFLDQKATAGIEKHVQKCLFVVSCCEVIIFSTIVTYYPKRRFEVDAPPGCFYHQISNARQRLTAQSYEGESVAYS